MLKAVNFGGGAESAFKTLRDTSPGQPAFTAEFWVGWFDQWEHPHHFVPAQEKLADFESMMRTGASFNLYMFHGGTTRGLWSGANWETRYRPTTESYDYAAPLDEYGRVTPKFEAFRYEIQRALKNETLPAVPTIPSAASIGTIALTEQCRLMDAMPEGNTTAKLQTLEDLGQSTGFILYRMSVEGPAQGDLALGQVKDRVQVLLDGKLLGISGRSTNGAAISLKIPEGKHRLDLLVENMGRINYGKIMQEERKGLQAPVMFNGKELGPFEQVGLPMQTPPTASYQEILRKNA